jgi:hypothetical protein
MNKKKDGLSSQDEHFAMLLLAITHTLELNTNNLDIAVDALLTLAATLSRESGGSKSALGASLNRVWDHNFVGDLSEPLIH